MPSSCEVKLLVVENDMDDYYIVKELLNLDLNKTYQTTQVSELAEAIALVDGQDFDAILLDLGLDDSSGLETLKSLRDVVSQVPIVVLTGVDDSRVGEQAITLGAEDYVAKNGLSSSLLTRVIAYAIERHRLLVKVKRQAEEDQLTGLSNRNYLCETLQTLIDQSERNGAKLAVAMLDLDGFKQVNDTYGHFAGDNLLVEIASRLRDNVRKSDVVGRWGGDEFLIIITNYADQATLLELLEKKKQCLLGTFEVESSGKQELVSIGASIGVVEWEPGSSLKQLIDQADKNMYVSKDSGNGVIVTD